MTERYCIDCDWEGNLVHCVYVPKSTFPHCPDCYGITMRDDGSNHSTEES